MEGVILIFIGILLVVFIATVFINHFLKDTGTIVFIIGAVLTLILALLSKEMPGPVLYSISGGVFLVGALLGKVATDKEWFKRILP